MSSMKWKLDYVPTLEWQIHWFVAVLTTLIGFKVWNHNSSEGPHWTRMLINSMLKSHTNHTHWVLHTEKLYHLANWWIVKNARSLALLNKTNQTLYKSEILTRLDNLIWIHETHFWITSNCTPSFSTKSTTPQNEQLFLLLLHATTASKNLFQESKNFSIHPSQQQTLNLKISKARVGGTSSNEVFNFYFNLLIFW